MIAARATWSKELAILCCSAKLLSSPSASIPCEFRRVNTIGIPLKETDVGVVDGIGVGEPVGGDVGEPVGSTKGGDDGH